jgi:hypothetical protein
MLNLYRRHLKTCQHRAKGQNYTKCSCPIWCDGELDGKRFRRSVGLRDWSRAVKRAEKWEAKPEQAKTPASLPEVIVSYLADCGARNLKESTIRSYTKTLDHLEKFCRSKGIGRAEHLDLSALTDFAQAGK